MTPLHLHHYFPLHNNQSWEYQTIPKEGHTNWLSTKRTRSIRWSRISCRLWFLRRSNLGTYTLIQQMASSCQQPTRQKIPKGPSSVAWMVHQSAIPSTCKSIWKIAWQSEPKLKMKWQRAWRKTSRECAKSGTVEEEGYFLLAGENITNEKGMIPSQIKNA